MNSRSSQGSSSKTAVAAFAALLWLSSLHQCHGFSSSKNRATSFDVTRRQRQETRHIQQLHMVEDYEEWSDFDGFIGGDNNSNEAAEKDSTASVTSFFKKRNSKDLSAASIRQFSLGQDFILVDFVGNMGFDEVTDWEYYYQNEEDPEDRKVVQPNPMDSSKPKRTRQSSGSVVRVFRGEFVGRIGGYLSSQGMDRRILVKEFTGELALKLAELELSSIGKLQSDLLADDNDATGGDWIQMASSRSIDASARQDDRNICELTKRLLKAPYLGIFGDVNLAELDGDMDPNDFYRALGVAPPKPEAVWIVYEYAGLNTVSSYSIPAEVRRSSLPMKRGFFGVSEPDPIPPFKDRANYVVNGIMKGAVEAVANLHDSGIVHRSIGRSSIIITTSNQDKREAASVYFTRPQGVTIKLSDFGFSSMLEEATNDEEFIARARTFGLSLRKGEDSLVATNFAMAEDLHALGFVFLGLLMSSLAEPRTAQSPMPPTDEDTLQRLLGEIFDRDINQFREYLEADNVWTNLVKLLDEKDGAGWTVLESLFKARETVAADKSGFKMVTARGILSNPFFQS